MLEVFADEWLPMVALHYRWNLEENKNFALQDFARSGFPYLPRFLGKPLVASMAKKMESYLPILGVTKHTHRAVEETALLVLRSLNEALQEQPYIFGGRPSLGDFALFGPLWAHLYRDPASRGLFDEYKNVQRWIETLRDNPIQKGEFLSQDVVPVALDSLFRCVLVDQWGWIKKLIAHIDTYCSKNPQAKRVPRALGYDSCHIQGVTEERKLITFVQWKAQRAQQIYVSSGEHCKDWLKRVVEGTGLSPDSCIPQIQNAFVIQDFKAVLKKNNQS